MCALFRSHMVTTAVPFHSDVFVSKNWCANGVWNKTAACNPQSEFSWHEQRRFGLEYPVQVNDSSTSTKRQAFWL